MVKRIKQDAKSKGEELVKTMPNIKSNKEHKQDTKPDIKLKQDVKKPDTNKIAYEEEKVALVLGTTNFETTNQSLP